MENPPFHNSIRVLIADDHRLFRWGIIELINNQSGIQIVEEASDGQELFVKYFKVLPDLVLADISMPIMSGIEAVYKIRSNDPSVKALFLSMYEGENYFKDCLAAGGKGLVSKSVMVGELINAIVKVNRGEFYYGENINENKFKNEKTKYEFSNNKINNKYYNVLTPREKDIVCLIGEGLSSIEISEKLNISRRTVDTIRSNLIQKLELKTLTELIQFSIRYVILHGIPV
jgi:two-component system, NarL family, response regulator NreC